MRRVYKQYKTLLNGRLHEIHTELKNKNQNKSDLDKKNKKSLQNSCPGMARTKIPPLISEKKKKRERKKW